MFKKILKIEGKEIGINRPCFIIAEAGVNHNGKLEMAKKLIDVAKTAGADAVKFQTWITEEIVTKNAPKAEYQKKSNGKTQYEMIKKLELTYDDFRELKKYADEKGIIFMSTPDDEKSVDFLHSIKIPAFKIGSGELTNDPMLKKIAKKNHPIILSTGMSTLEEVSHAIDVIAKTGNKKLVLLHCTSRYPTKIEEINLKAMLILQQEFGVPVGYSDHTLGIDVSIAAACLGATVIEKHFTISKKLSGPDHKSSLEPDELKIMIKEIRKIEKMSPEERSKKMDSIKDIQIILGSSEKKPTAGEIETAKVVRKNIVAKKIISRGTRITKADLAMKRSVGTGLYPKDIDKLVGKYAKKTIQKDEIVRLKDVNKRRKIVYVTGTRAEYGVMYQTLEAINQHPHLDLSLIVTGLHLSAIHGYTLSGIKKDGFKIDAVVDAKIEKMDNVEMAKSIGHCLIGIAEKFRKIRPDIVLLEGDRGEVLAAAIAAAHMNIPIVHISGGDISGSIDNSLRKAITNFAHIHLANTPKSAKRLLKIGEQPWRVKMIGALGLDYKFEKIIPSKELSSKFDLNLKKPIILVAQHPVAAESKNAGLQMKKTLDAVVKLKQQTILIYPNADAGSIKMIKVIERYRKHDFIRVFESLTRRTFLSLMAIADVLIGNSSAGLVETPMFNLSTINIGTRQKGRERANNIIDVGYDTDEIYDATKKILSYKTKQGARKIRTPYKNLNTANKIVDVLFNLKIDNKLLNKYGE